jgi:hypothetical protein
MEIKPKPTKAQRAVYVLALFVGGPIVLALIYTHIKSSSYLPLIADLIVGALLVRSIFSPPSLVVYGRKLPTTVDRVVLWMLSALAAIVAIWVFWAQL